MDTRHVVHQHFPCHPLPLSKHVGPLQATVQTPVPLQLDLRRAQMSWGLQAGETLPPSPPHTHTHTPAPAQRCDFARAVKWSAQLLIAVMVFGEGNQGSANQV